MVSFDLAANNGHTRTATILVADKNYIVSQSGLLGNINQLQNNVTISNLSATLRSSQQYFIDVPENALSLQCNTWGGVGDSDLYMRYGVTPSDTVWDYDSNNYGNSDAITISAPQNGKWYVRCYGYQAFSGLNINCTYQKAYFPWPVFFPAFMRGTD